MPHVVKVLIAASQGRSEFLATILTADPALEIVGTTSTAAGVVRLAQERQPHVVALDIDLGLPCVALIETLMARRPMPIVVVVARRTGEFALSSADEISVCVSALGAGALTVVRDPFQAASVLKQMAQVKVARRAPREMPCGRGAGGDGPDAPIGHRRGRIVAIASSVGGPHALSEILSRLPADFPVPIVVAQHMAEGFIDGLAGWLDTGCPLTVRVARDGEALQPGVVLLAPHDRHLQISPEGTAILSDAPPVAGFRPAGTVLYETVARTYGPSAVAVILTGLGSDGVKGLETVRRMGGHVLAQDQETAVAFGMPGAAIAAGVCDAVLPVSRMASRLTEIVS